MVSVCVCRRGESAREAPLKHEIQNVAYVVAVAVVVVVVVGFYFIVRGVKKFVE
jgi:heme/copper-type cytochrome/quinol oxidase subunit 2